MASTYSPNLRLELIGTGEQQGTWGSTTNTNLGTLLEEAIGGYTSVTVSNLGDTTLTTNNGSADQSRNMVINLTGTISAARNVICPAIEKLYVVKNATTGGFDVTFKVSGQTGVTIPNGETYFLYVNGVDAQKIVGNVASTNTTNTFTENQIIQVTDNTDAALRITQLGTGNALLVEDSANPDGTPMIITQAGQVVTGYTATVNADNSYGGQITPRIQTHGTITDNAALAATIWTASGAASQLVLAKSRGTTIGTNAVVQNNDDLGAIAFDGDDGSSFIVAASIVGSVDGTPGTNNMPGRVTINTTPAGGSVPVEAVRVNNLGYMAVNTQRNPDSTLEVRGTGTPTGIMIASISGTTLTVDGVTSGDVAVGDRVFADGVEYNTYVTALGTGTGGVGTYTVNNTQTVAQTNLFFVPAGDNRMSFYDSDTTSITNQPIGAVEWFNTDASTPGAGVKAYIATIAESATPDTAMLFGTSDNVSSTQAVERMRLTSAGRLGIGTRVPDAILSVNGVASFGDGAVGAPSIANFGDLNTGIWFPAEDTIAFSEGGVEVMRINSSANVGIGTSSPGGRLDVQGGTIEFDPGVGADATRAFNFNIGGQNYGKILIPFGGGGAMAFWTGAAGLAAERMRIGSAGNVAIGGTINTAFSLRVAKDITGSSAASGVYSDGTIQTDANAIPTYFSGLLRTAAASFTVSDAQIYRAAHTTLGAGSAITRLYGYTAADLTAATTNYGFFASATAASITTGKTYFGYYEGSNAASGGGVSWAFYANGTANSYFGGNVGIGSTVLSAINLRISRQITGAAFAYGSLYDGVVQSDVTSVAAGVTTFISTAAASFSTTLNHFQAIQATMGAGSSLTTQTGYLASESNIFATNNYGFLAGNTAAVTSGKTAYGFFSNVNVASGGGTTWGFFANGTAWNYFAGPVILDTNLWVDAPAPTVATGAATLTAAQIRTGIISTTGTTYTLTLPTGTSIDSGFTGIPANTNVGFDVSFVNTASGTITIAVNTNVTSLGSLTIATGTSALFRFRRTAANTYVVYRMA
jgi:hypothetical protein